MAFDEMTAIAMREIAEVEKSLREALSLRGYREEGNVVTLAQRCRDMAREDRDVIDGLVRLKDHFKERASLSPAQGGAEPRSLPKIIHVLAEWEDKNGSLAGVMADEWNALREAVVDAAIVESPRMVRAATHPSAPQQEQAQGWRPIESAPKDGREVVLAVESRAGITHGVLVGHYMAGGHCIEDHPAIDAGWYFWNGCMFDKASRPTHWMPLPHHPEWKPDGWQAREQSRPLPASTNPNLEMK